MTSEKDELIEGLIQNMSEANRNGMWSALRNEPKEVPSKFETRPEQRAWILGYEGVETAMKDGQSFCRLNRQVLHALSDQKEGEGASSCCIIMRMPCEEGFSARENAIIIVHCEQLLLVGEFAGLNLTRDGTPVLELKNPCYLDHPTGRMYRCYSGSGHLPGASSLFLTEDRIQLIRNIESRLDHQYQSTLAMYPETFFIGGVNLIG